MKFYFDFNSPRFLDFSLPLKGRSSELCSFVLDFPWLTDLTSPASAKECHTRPSGNSYEYTRLKHDHPHQLLGEHGWDDVVSVVEECVRCCVRSALLGTSSSFTWADARSCTRCFSNQLGWFRASFLSWGALNVAWPLSMQLGFAPRCQPLHINVGAFNIFFGNDCIHRREMGS